MVARATICPTVRPRKAVATGRSSTSRRTVARSRRRAWRSLRALVQRSWHEARGCHLEGLVFGPDRGAGRDRLRGRAVARRRAAAGADPRPLRPPRHRAPARRADHRAPAAPLRASRAARARHSRPVAAEPPGPRASHGPAAAPRHWPCARPLRRRPSSPADARPPRRSARPRAAARDPGRLTRGRITPPRRGPAGHRPGRRPDDHPFEPRGGARARSSKPTRRRRLAGCGSGHARRGARGACDGLGGARAVRRGRPGLRRRRRRPPRQHRRPVRLVLGGRRATAGRRPRRQAIWEPAHDDSDAAGFAVLYTAGGPRYVRVEAPRGAAPRYDHGTWTRRAASSAPARRPAR